VPRGITLRLEGDANDYLGKGLSGGRIVVRPDRAATFNADEQIIAGNVIAFGPVEGAAAEELHQLVRDHAEETGSEVAAALLADWPASLTRFTEVMPTDYRTVLEAKARAEADGLDEHETARAMMEALHG
jgi:glutamate synthase (NADPH/NADH) large chain